MSATEANDLGVENSPHVFAEVYEQARATLLPALRRRVGPAAEDLFQEALLIAFERWDRVHGVENKVAWIRTVSMRLAGRWQQREGRRPAIESINGASMPASSSLGLNVDLMDALAELRPEHAAAFRMTQIDDLEVAAAATRLSVAEPTVKVWIHRSRHRLAERSTGWRGRWMCESQTSPAALERSLNERGHTQHVDDAMPCLVDRHVRWQLEIGDGKYWLGTDDGERMDQGNIGLGARGASLRSVRIREWVDGASVPAAVRDVGTSIHSVDIDGDRMRLRLTSTDIQPTNGVPDIVYRQVFFHDIVYRWVGPLEKSSHLSRPTET